MILGSNPPQNGQNDEAFPIDCFTRKRLDKWLENINITVKYINVADFPTIKNKQLTIKQIKDSLPGLKSKINAHYDGKLIVLGRIAEKAIKMLIENGMKIEYLYIPHPSGKNFAYNDVEFLNQTIQKVREYVAKS